jgi:hypothetical protein
VAARGSRGQGPREAVALAAETEFVDLRGDSLLALAEVLRLVTAP